MNGGWVARAGRVAILVLMVFLLVSVVVVAWCVVPLPLAVAVGRSLRQSSPEHVPAKLARELEGSRLVASTSVGGAG